ncbi:MAG: CotH kinase family protein [Rikenellaceae bacterium]
MLLANYTDKSALRTSVAFALSELTNLSYTPRWKFYDLYLNDEYQGCYLLSEHKKISDDRVNVGDDGFLLEVDQLSRVEEGDVYFYTETMGILLNIKDSNDVEYDTDEYEWIKSYMTEAENALYGENFKDEEIGYKKYFNVESFADWYVVNELAKNNDAIFYSSCMMNVTRAGVISMGPVWDFDIAFGNCNYNNSFSETGFWVKESNWISRLFEDPYFVNLVIERFAVLKNNIGDIYDLIDTYEVYLLNSQVANDNVWGTLGKYVWPNFVWYDTYPEEVAYMKEWLATRLSWMENALNELKTN